MSFRDCLDNAEKEGRLSPARAAELRALYDENFRQLELSLGAAAENEAARRTFDAAVFEAAERRRRTLLQAKVGKDHLARQAAFRNMVGHEDPAEYMINIVESQFGKLPAAKLDPAAFEGRGPTPDIPAANLMDILNAQSHGRLAELLTAFERDAFGRTRNKPLAEEIEDAIYAGGKSGNPRAAFFAKTVTDEFERLRKRFNAGGGHIGKLDRYAGPQVWNAQKVGALSFEEWKGRIGGRLDRARMIDWATQKPFTPARLDAVLKDAYASIVSNGEINATPQGGARALANRRADHRVLIFKSAEDARAVRNEFGDGDWWQAAIGHIQRMNRDIALLETLGPNPRATMALLKAEALTRSAERRLVEGPGGAVRRRFTLSDRAKAKANVAEAMLNDLSGQQNDIGNAWFVDGFRGLRDFTAASKLGSAFLSAGPGDIVTNIISRRMNGLPLSKFIVETLGRMQPFFEDARTKDKQWLFRSGANAEGAVATAHTQARYVGDLHLRGVLRHVSDASLRITGLTPWTSASRWSFHNDFTGLLAGASSKSMKELAGGDAADRALARTLGHYGLADFWDVIRATPLTTHPNGGAFLWPTEVARRTDIAPAQAEYLGNRLLHMIRSEMAFSTPTSSLRGRVALVDKTQEGTLVGQLVRSGAMFKGFGTTITQLLILRAVQAAMRGTVWDGVGFFAATMIGLTAAGAVSLQLKDIIVRGLDPRPMDTPEFWQAAWLQGGGAGIYGDFLYSSQNRFGGGVGATLTGPAFGTLGDVAYFAGSNIDAGLKGEDTHAPYEAAKLIGNNLPGGTAWFARLIMQRRVVEAFQRMADPDKLAEDARAQIGRRENEFDQSYFWAPGSPAPERAPELGAALGDN